jgi:Type I restriction-modification system methyltransferase subunit
MSAAINKSSLNNFAEQIWKSAIRLRGKFKGYEYQNVIMPMVVIRRLECVLINWRIKEASKIKSQRPAIKEKELDALVKKLELNPRNIPFSNKTSWTLRKICDEDPTLLEKNFRAYINGFSENIQDIINSFDFRATIGKMVTNARLESILNQYANEKLGPDQFSHLEMGYIYEELLRRFSEQNGEEAGDHFTPREIIRLMVELLDIPLPQKHISIYDPAGGTGGMLSVSKEHLLDKTHTEKEQNNVESLVSLHGHEIQPSNYAICQADMLIKDDKHAHIYYGNSLIPHKKVQNREPGDQLADQTFDYMLSNPPFGVTWGGKDGYEKEAKEYADSRYKAGMPRTTDGALLFLQTMLAKMKSEKEGGSKIAIIFNGSPLSNGDCDVRQMLKIQELETFQRFVRLCAGRTGQLLNLSSLATECGITHNTAKAWISVLEASYLVFLLRPHSVSFNKRLVKMPKLYFYDVGLTAWLLGIRTKEQMVTHPLRGNIFETFIISELIKSKLNFGEKPAFSFWRDSNGNEVDLIVELGTKLMPIEIKSSRTLTHESFAGLEKWRVLAGEKSTMPVLIYGGDESYQQKGIKVIGWKECGQFLK